MADLSELAPALHRDARGYWTGGPAPDVSYPDEGTEFCFALENESFWFAHRNRVILEAVRRAPPAGALYDVGAGNASSLPRFWAPATTRLQSSPIHVVQAIPCRGAYRRFSGRCSRRNSVRGVREASVFSTSSSTSRRTRLFSRACARTFLREGASTSPLPRTGGCGRTRTGRPGTSGATRSVHSPGCSAGQDSTSSTRRISSHCSRFLCFSCGHCALAVRHQRQPPTLPATERAAPGCDGSFWLVFSPRFCSYGGAGRFRSARAASPWPERVEQRRMF